MGSGKSLKVFEWKRDFIISVRKVNLIVDGRMEDWQGKRTKVGERLGGSLQ